MKFAVFCNMVIDDILAKEATLSVSNPRRVRRNGPSADLLGIVPGAGQGRGEEAQLTTKISYLTTTMGEADKYLIYGEESP